MAPASQFKLYTNLATRGGIVEWYCQEIGVQYDPVVINLSANEQKASWFTKITQMGQVPVLQAGELTLTQSGAMLLYIADKHDARVNTPEDRALCAQWVLFASTDLAELLFNKDLPEGRLESVLGYLETCLAANPFVAGGDFTVGDVAVASYLLFCKLSLDKWPSVAAYVKRASARPACEATLVQGINSVLCK